MSDRTSARQASHRQADRRGDRPLLPGLATTNTFGADRFTSRAGEFDANDPDNVSPWVVYLATDDAADITGQTFVCGGDQVQVMETWHRVGRIRKGKDRWTVAELMEARKELFGDRPTSIGKFEM